MLAVLETFRQGVDDLHGLTRSHGLWMAWNLILAVVPLALAVPLFRARRRTGAVWWTGFVVFVLFLPNAPYVLTDVIHLFDDIRASRSDLQVLGLYLPVYLAFFTVGVVSYAASLERLWSFVSLRVSFWAALAVELTLHVLAAVGVYLGRVVRLNSWQVFTRPRQVLGSLDGLLGPFPIVMIAITAGVLFVCSASWRVGRAGVDALIDQRFPDARPRLRRRLRWSIAPLDAEASP